MARKKSYIEIEGIFATEVLGSFNIIRGSPLFKIWPVFLRAAEARTADTLAGDHGRLLHRHAVGRAGVVPFLSYYGIS